LDFLHIRIGSFQFQHWFDYFAHKDDDAFDENNLPSIVVFDLDFVSG
jgi:hypothetical protein